MKTLVLMLLLCSTIAFASPITVDQIIAPNGLSIQSSSAIQIKSGNANLTLPSDYVNEQILTQSSAVTLTNKTFDQTNNVALQKQLVYDYAVLGGATDTSYSLGFSLPDNVVVTKSWIDVITPLAGGSTATVGISSLAGADILADTAIADITGFVAGKQTGATNTFIKMSGATTVKVDVKTDALSAGKFVLFLDYVISK